MPSLLRYPTRLTLNATRARQARLGRPVLWVLLVSTTLAALAMFGAWSAETSPAGVNRPVVQQTPQSHAN
jgi:hypothetical protein